MSRRLKIFVMDDSLNLGRELLSWLDETGYKIVCHPVAGILLHRIQAYQPGLILLGIPGYASQGMALYERLKNHRQLCHVPIIVFSDDPNLEYEVLDAFDFQTPPLDRDRLKSCLKRLTGQQNHVTEISSSTPELSEVKNYLHERTGLYFNQNNQRLLERGLMRRMQALRMQSLPKYLRYLEATPDNYDEINKLVGLLTVGETSFFRYRSHRDALQHYVVPRLIEQNSAERRLRIWSAGCSTGEEPYSLAILLKEYFPQLGGWDIRILATDINKRALRRAREGLYGERSLRLMAEPLRDKYFQRVGRDFHVAEQIRRMVRFDYFNLQTDSIRSMKSSIRDIDLLLCRNVLIYFNLETIRRIVGNFSEVLGPHGFLFLGHAETMQNVSDRFQRHHQSSAYFYQKKDAATETSAAGKTGASPPAGPKSNDGRMAQHSASELTEGGRQETKPLDLEKLYRQAMDSFDRERFTEADQLFDTLLTQQPRNAKALVGKGLLMANQGKYKESRIYCARAISEDDLLPQAYLLRGLILDMEGHLERALVEYQKVLWLDASFVMAHYLSAKVYDCLGEDDKKNRALRNTIRILEKPRPQNVILFSGGLSRSVFLEIAHRELEKCS